MCSQVLAHCVWWLFSKDHPRQTQTNPENIVINNMQTHHGINSHFNEVFVCCFSLHICVHVCSYNCMYTDMKEEAADNVCTLLFNVYLPDRLLHPFYNNTTLLQVYHEVKHDIFNQSLSSQASECLFLLWHPLNANERKSVLACTCLSCMPNNGFFPHFATSNTLPV